MQVIMRTDRLLVEQLESPEVTEGGIILPTQAKVKQAWATVLMVGPDVEGIDYGDRIAFADFSGVDMELDMADGKKTYLVLSQDDVLLVLREESEEQDLNKQELMKYVDNNKKERRTEQGPQENSEVHCSVESSGSDVRRNSEQLKDTVPDGVS